MVIKSDITAKEAKHGQKMVELKVRFWTDAISAEKGKIIPKHAWAAGVVRMERNDAHEIVPSDPIPFNTLLELNAVIEKALIAHGIVLHSTPKMRKYLSNAKDVL
jgi:hypothetical protein